MRWFLNIKKKEKIEESERIQMKFWGFSTHDSKHFTEYRNWDKFLTLQLSRFDISTTSNPLMLDYIAEIFIPYTLSDFLGNFLYRIGYKMVWKWFKYLIHRGSHFLGKVVWLILLILLRCQNKNRPKNFLFTQFSKENRFNQPSFSNYVKNKYICSPNTHLF